MKSAAVARPFRFVPALFLAFTCAGCSFPIDDFVVVDGAYDVAPDTAGGSDVAVDATKPDGVGVCPLPKTLCATLCVDLTSDVHHCGQCDQDCGGGTCRSGKCKGTGGGG